MMAQDGYSMKDRAKMLLEKFDCKKYALAHCELIIQDEFYGTDRQIYYRKLKELIKNSPGE